MTSFFRSAKNPIYFIAEIGGNHEGDFEYAKRLLKLAAESGADAVKFQIYTGDTLVSRVESPDRNAHFKRFELKKEQYLELAQMCRDFGVTFMASVWDPEALDWIDEHMPIYKIGSGDVTAYPVIKEHVRRGKPLILSTGLCTLADVRQVVDYIGSLDASYIEERKLALLQCTSMYPIPDEDANLGVMETFRNEFKLPVGYSDHTVGSDAILAAIALGAEIIEAHFTDTREGKTFRDHKVSLTSAEIRDVLARARRIAAFRGNGVKAPTASELANGHVESFRRAIYVKKPIEKGAILTVDNTTVLRPAHGIPATDYDKILGRRIQCDRQAHDPIRWEDLD